MSECAAAEEVAAERFIMIIVEQVRDIGAGYHVVRKPVADVELDDAIVGTAALWNTNVITLPSRRYT